MAVSRSCSSSSVSSITEASAPTSVSLTTPTRAAGHHGVLLPPPPPPPPPGAVVGAGGVTGGCVARGSRWRERVVGHVLGRGDHEVAPDRVRDPGTVPGARLVLSLGHAVPDERHQVGRP